MQYEWDKCHWGPPTCLGSLKRPFESSRGTWMGFICLEEYTLGLEKFNGSQWQLLMAVSRGRYGSAQDIKEEINITGYKGGLRMHCGSELNTFQHEMRNDADYAQKLEASKQWSPTVPFLGSACMWLQILLRQWICWGGQVGILIPNQTKGFGRRGLDTGD